MLANFRDALYRLFRLGLRSKRDQRLECNANLRFSQVDICYNYAFDLGHPVNPVDAARRLLRTSFAGGFKNYETGKSEIAECYRYPSAQYRRYLDAQQVIQTIQPGCGPRPYLKLLLVDPVRWGPALFHAIRQSFSNGQESAHGSVAVDDEENTKREDFDEAQVTSAVADFVVALFGRLAIQECADRAVFHEDYLEKLPFVRVSLQPFEAVFGSERVCFNVMLTIHRSGIAILSAYGSLSPGLEAQRIVQLLHPSPIYGCEIPSTVVNRYYFLLHGIHRAFGEEFACEDRSSHACIDFEGEAELEAIFDAYRYSVIEAVQGRSYKSLDRLHRSLRSQQYLGYPIIFAKYPAVTTGEDFRTRYAEPLARLVLGFQGQSSLRRSKVEETCAGDLSVTDHDSLYLTEGSAIELYYGEEEHEISQLVSTFETAAVIDILILQRMILSTYGAQLNQVTLDASGLDLLNRIRRDLMLMLEEYEVLGLSHYGSIHDFVQRGQETMRIKDMHALFVQRLESIEGLVRIVESKRRAAQDRLLKIITTIVAALLSLPAADSIIEVLQGWASVLSMSCPLWIRPFFLWLKVEVNQVLFAVVLYLLIVVVTLVALWGGPARNWLIRREKAVPTSIAMRSRGRTLSPMSYTVTHIDTADTPKEN